MSCIKQNRLKACLQKSPEKSDPVARILKEYSYEPAVRILLCGISDRSLSEAVGPLIKLVIGHFADLTVFEPFAECLTREAVLYDRIDRLKRLRRILKRFDVPGNYPRYHFPLDSPYLS